VAANSTPIFISADQDRASQAAFLNENFRRLNDELSISNFDAGTIALSDGDPANIGNSTATYSHGILIDDTGIYACADGQTATDANVRILIDGSAYFSGTVTAGAGAIGGWSIGADSLSASTGTVGMSSAVTAGDDIRFWAGHATMASAPFRVTEAGVLTATSGSIGGWTLATDKLSYGTDADYIGLIPATGIQLGDSTFADAPFSVTNAGVLKAVSGTVGGWTLATTSLKCGATTTTVGLDTGGTNPAIYAGSATPASAPFRVTNTGDLTSTSATITGSITSTTGSIGGWTIGATSLTSGTGATTVGLDSGGTNPAIYAGSATPASAPFRVSNSGALTATNITATGTINAQSGYLASGVYINSTDTILCESAGLNVGVDGHIRGGQTDFNTGSGFFLGYSTDDYKFSVGSSTNSLTWNGESLSINGKLATTAPINLKTYATGDLPGSGTDTSANLPSANAGYGAGNDVLFSTYSNSIDTMEYVGAGDGFTVTWGQSFTIGTSGNLRRISLFINSASVNLYVNNIAVTASTKYWVKLGPISGSTIPASLCADDSGKPGTVLSLLYTDTTYSTQKTFNSGDIIKGATAGGLANGEFGIGTAGGDWYNGSKDAYISVWTTGSLTDPEKVYGAGYAYLDSQDFDDIDIQISKDGGTSWSTIKTHTANPDSETTLTYGSSSDTWGLTLTGADINHSTNFRVRFGAGVESQGVYYNHDFYGFGFAETAGNSVLGLTIAVVSYFDTDDGSLYINSITVKARMSSSDATVVEGSTAYDSTLNTLTCYDGSSWESVALQVYPVGAIYISVASTSPATLFGGTWAAFGAGKVLVGIDATDADFDTVEETGGAKTVAGDAHTHTLSDAGQAAIYMAATSGVNRYMRRVASSWTSTHKASDGVAEGDTGSKSYGAALSGATDSTTPDATSVVQPYITVYMWKRTA